MQELLEREADLAVLRAAAVAARDGRGSVVVVAGEAGIGKTSLVRAWADAPGTDCRVLVGLCDDLITRRTLGPFHDIARRTGGDLTEAVGRADTAAVCEAVLVELDHPLHATAFLLEDVHWADEATLDVLRYVGRRIAALRGVLVVTYRDDDLGTGHPLAGVLGALATVPVHHLALRRLSAEAVAALAGAAGLDGAEVFRLTAGNPFFVSEVAADPEGVPTSVVDSVLSRLQALPAAARSASELLSVIPRPVSLSFAESLSLDLSAIATAESHGLLTVDGDLVGFRHDLTRLAILDGLPVAVRAGHHRDVLNVLLEQDAEAATVLHHAVLSRRTDVIVRHGLAAAREAYRAGAHREAAQYQRHVLEHQELLEPDTLAQLLEERAWSLYYLHRFSAAVVAARRAVVLRRSNGEATGLARALATLSRMEYLANEPQAATAAAAEAVAVAETGDVEVLAEARLARAALHSLLDRREEAREETAAVLEVAQQLGRSDLESLALNYLATCGPSRDESADVIVSRFIRAIELARAGGHLEAAARAYTNLVSELVWRGHPERWRWYEEAVAFTTDHDFPSFRFNIVAQGSHFLVSEGRWPEAETALRGLLAEVDEPGLLELVALEALARLLLRRGDPEGDMLLQRAWSLALRSEAAQYIGPIAALRAEKAFLYGDDELANEIRAAVALEALDQFTRGELVAYLRRAGVELADVPGPVAEIWQPVLAGDHAAAAERWSKIGNPYEQALELQAIDDASNLLEALAILGSLGATPAVQLVRRRLRELGVRSIPRGPNSGTRKNPAGLTARQLEVLDLIQEGLTNAEIAARLVVSVRTVDHHVSAVLRKLGVTTRQEAAAVNVEMEGR